MKALPWIALGMSTLAAALFTVSYVIRARDREVLQTKFAQYLPG